MRRELIDRLIKSGQSLEAELLLWRDWQSPDAAVAGPAVAQMAEMLEQGNISRGGRLLSAARPGVCRCGLPRRQDRKGIACGLCRPAAGVSNSLNMETVWPVGQVEFEKKSSQASHAVQHSDAAVPERIGSVPCRHVGRQVSGRPIHSRIRSLRPRNLEICAAYASAGDQPKLEFATPSLPFRGIC